MPPHRRVVAQESSAADIYLRIITQFEIVEGASLPTHSSNGVIST